MARRTERSLAGLSVFVLAVIVSGMWAPWPVASAAMQANESVDSKEGASAIDAESLEVELTDDALPAAGAESQTDNGGVNQTQAVAAERNLFITANPVDLSQISQVSKFRSCSGHDYSGVNAEGVLETNRSMKHYLAPASALARSVGKVKVFAPFDGSIRSIQDDGGRGWQVWLTPASAESWVFVFFHTDVLPNFGEGVTFAAGTQIGYANLDQDAHDFDIALKSFTPGAATPQNAVSGQRDAGRGRGDGSGGGPGGSVKDPRASLFTEVLDSPFLHVAPNVLDQFAAHGVTSDNVVISRAERDAKPCAFSPGQDSPTNWVSVS